MSEPDSPHGQEREAVPVWVFIAALLLLYGLIVLGAGLAHWHHPAAVALADLHATFWGGLILTVLSAIFLALVWPRRAKKP